EDLSWGEDVFTWEVARQPGHYFGHRDAGGLVAPRVVAGDVRQGTLHGVCRGAGALAADPLAPARHVVAVPHAWAPSGGVGPPISPAIRRPWRPRSSPGRRAPCGLRG